MGERKGQKRNNGISNRFPLTAGLLLTTVMLCFLSASVESNAEEDSAKPVYRVTVSEDRLDFGTEMFGYSEAPDAQEVTITNNCSENVSIEILDSQEPVSYTIEGYNSGDTIDKGESKTIKIRPKAGLSAGSHEESFIIHANSTDALPVSIPSVTLYFSFEVTALNEIIGVSPKEVSFGSTTEGYKTTPDSKAVNVTNEGNTALTVKVPSPKNYKLTGFDEDKVLEVGEDFTFYVAPNTGLSKGDQKETIKLETKNGTANTFSTSFTVVAPPEVKVAGILKIEEGVSTTLLATATGGTAPYTYVWEHGEAGAEINVMPKEDTTYKVTVTDAAGVTASGEAKVLVGMGLHVRITGEAIISEGGATTLTAEVEDGLTPYSYSWNTVPVQTTKSIQVSPTRQTTYVLTVTDKLGAIATDRVTVKISKNGEPVTEPDYSLELNPGNLEFGVLERGYKAVGLGQSITMTNIGDTDVILRTPGSAYFNFTGITEGTILPPQGDITIFISPKEELPEGDYQEQLFLRTLEGSKASLTAAFTVKKKSIGASAELTDESISESKTYPYGKGAIEFILGDETGTSLLQIPHTVDFMNHVLTPEQLQQVNDGAQLVIRLWTNSLADDINKEDKELIDDAIVYFGTEYPGIQLGTYMEVFLEMQINGGEWKQIADIGELKLKLLFPEAIAEKSNHIYLLSTENGICRKNTDWDGKEDNALFSMKNAGTYAIAYTPADLEKAEGFKQKQGQNIVLWCVLMTGIVAVFGAGIWFMLSRNRSRREKRRDIISKHNQNL